MQSLPYRLHRLKAWQAGGVHVRLYRIYRELELNLRIKPKKRMVREKPAALAVPTVSDDVWSMDFMHDQLSDGREIAPCMAGHGQCVT